MSEQRSMDVRRLLRLQPPAPGDRGFEVTIDGHGHDGTREIALEGDRKILGDRDDAIDWTLDRLRSANAGRTFRVTGGNEIAGRIHITWRANIRSGTIAETTHYARDDGRGLPTKALVFEPDLESEGDEPDWIQIDEHGTITEHGR